MTALRRPPFSIVAGALLAAIVIACTDPGPRPAVSASEAPPAASSPEAIMPVVLLPPPDIKTEAVLYKDGEAELEGQAVWDANVKGKRPGVMVVHQWMGITAHETGRSAELAKLGYVAFVADIYGKGVRPKSREEAGAQAGRFRADPALFRSRVTAALTALKGNANVDAAKVAAIGYCFGGGAVLELARTGADLRGVVSFHGTYKTETPASAETLKAKILICHGAEDTGQEPHLPGLIAELKAAKADWLVVTYAGGVHGFTHAGDAERHHPAADRRSWQHMRDFFVELFQ